MRKIKYGLLALLIVTPLFLIAIDQSYAFFGRWQTKVGNPPPPGEAPPDDGGGKPGPRPTLGEFKSMFNVWNCSSSSTLEKNCPRASSARERFVYQIFSVPLSSNRYKKLLTEDGKINVYLRPPPAGGGITGGANYFPRNQLHLWGYYEFGLGTLTRWSAIHESGHLIQYRNSGVYSNFKVRNLADRDGGDCYDEGSDGPYIQTYAFRSPAIGGGGSKEESFGEAVGMNVVCSPNLTCFKGRRSSKAITNYPKKCNNTYNWIKNNVYGGVDFFGLK